MRSQDRRVTGRGERGGDNFTVILPLLYAAKGSKVLYVFESPPLGIGVLGLASCH